MFKLIEALKFSKEETAAFWFELDAAYARDRAIQEAASETCGMV